MRFAELTHRDALADVLAGLEAARHCGFDLIKINMVWLPEVNGDEVDAMIDYCLSRRFVLRLIENMPMGDAARKLGSRPLQPLIAGLRQRFGLVDDVIPGGGPARYLTSPDHSFSVGFITPVSQHFCATCNRLRLSVDGMLHLCLGQENQVDFRSVLRDGGSDADIETALLAAVRNKPERHEFVEQPQRMVRVMSSTGG
jgi:cyclic pyranopterin phosphate synthase